jgi:hypothetical protein
LTAGFDTLRKCRAIAHRDSDSTWMTGRWKRLHKRSEGPPIIARSPRLRLPVLESFSSIDNQPLAKSKGRRAKPRNRLLKLDQALPGESFNYSQGARHQKTAFLGNPRPFSVRRSKWI